MTVEFSFRNSLPNPLMPIGSKFKIENSTGAIFDADDWVVSSATSQIGTALYITVFEATSASIGDTTGIDEGFQNLGSLPTNAFASGAAVDASYSVSGDPVRGNIQMIAQPDTLPDFAPVTSEIWSLPAPLKLHNALTVIVGSEK